MLKVTVVCFLASYIVALLMELSRTLGTNRLSRFVTLGVGLAGFVAQTMYLLARHQQTGLPPLLSSTHDWMLVLAWMLVLFYLFLTAIHPELALGIFILPLVLCLVVATCFMSYTPNPLLDPDRAQRGWKMLHSVLLVLGTGGMAAGFISACMYLVQHHRLKTRHAVHTGWEMPSLSRLAQANRWSVMIAFPLLTLGFASGVVLALQSRGPGLTLSFSDPIVIGSSVLWLVLASVFMRMLAHRRPTGKQVAWLTFLASGLLLLTLVGLQITAGKHVFRMNSMHTAVPQPNGADSALHEGRGLTAGPFSEICIPFAEPAPDFQQAADRHKWLCHPLLTVRGLPRGAAA